MEIPIKDKSNYLKGLLIVAKKDKQLADSEKKIIRGIGEKLGFAPDFYEDVLKDLLSNEYILEDPIKFSNLKIAKSFIDDGLKLAYSDHKISEVEINWLRETAKHNDIDGKWFNDKLEHYKNNSSSFSISDFALYSIIG
jgi:uncharacterized tellurite resistance protein B-like protein